MATAGSVHDLVPGDHACLTFTDAEERLDVIAAFVRQGLDRGEKVVCFTEAYAPAALAEEFADRDVAAEAYARDGQLELCGTDDAFLVDGAFSATRMIDSLARKVDRACAEGYEGLRFTADMAWASRPVAGLEQLVVFEAEVNELFTDGRLAAICQYDRTRFDSVTLALAAELHPRAVAATIYHEDPVLRVCRQHSPAGVRMAGEADFTYLPALTHAIGETVRLDANPHLNLRDLLFMDAAAATAVLHGALSLADGRIMTVTCPPDVAKTLRVLGADDVPHLRVLVRDGRR
jgi:anti-anti-sigma regulatory factor